MGPIHNPKLIDMSARARNDGSIHRPPMTNANGLVPDPENLQAFGKFGRG